MNKLVNSIVSMYRKLMPWRFKTNKQAVTKEQIKDLLQKCRLGSVDVIFDKGSIRDCESSRAQIGQEKVARIHKSMTLRQCKKEIKRAISNCNGTIGRFVFDEIELFYISLPDIGVEEK